MSVSMTKEITGYCPTLDREITVKADYTYYETTESDSGHYVRTHFICEQLKYRKPCSYQENCPLKEMFPLKD